MKKITGLLFLVTVLLAGCLLYVPQGGEYGSPDVSPPPQERPDDSWNYDNQGQSDYYGYLGPYGLWVTYSPYGYVWIPRDIDLRWRPYFRGHWLWTDYGWTWMGQERWAWLVYHYGRWGWDGRLGWYWVPGTVWGPSWVAWRWGDPYIGWAPLPPGDDFVPGYGFRRRDFDIPHHYWNFVHGRDFMDRSLDRWVVPPERNVTIINYTKVDVNIHVRNNRIINDGVGVDRVRRMTNQTIETRVLQDARKPGEERVDARDVVLYRPDIRRSETARPKEAFNPDQAARRIDEGQAPVGVVRRAVQNEEVQVRRSHDLERRRLEEDQRTEVEAIRRRADSEKVAVRNPADKQKIETETKAKIADAQKRHAVEKAELARRQKSEEERAKRVPPKRREDEKS